MEFKDRIKQLREEKNLDLTKLAAEFDMKEAGVRAWELGRTKPGADTLIRLAKYFDCTTDYLLGLSVHRSENEVKNANKQLSEIWKLVSKTENPEIMLDSLRVIMFYCLYFDTYRSEKTGTGEFGFAAIWGSLTNLMARSLLTASNFFEQPDNDLGITVNLYADCGNKVDSYRRAANSMFTLFYLQLQRYIYERAENAIENADDKQLMLNLARALTDGLSSDTVSADYEAAIRKLAEMGEDVTKHEDIHDDEE